MSDYTHDDAMRDLERMEIRGLDTVGSRRVRYYITKLEDDRDRWKAKAEWLALNCEAMDRGMHYSQAQWLDIAEVAIQWEQETTS
jgi:hypothetical protein